MARARLRAGGRNATPRGEMVCACFSFCTLREATSSLKLVPNTLHANSPWLGYLRSVYGQDFAVESGVVVDEFLHTHQCARTHRNPLRSAGCAPSAQPLCEGMEKKGSEKSIHKEMHDVADRDSPPIAPAPASAIAASDTRLDISERAPSERTDRGQTGGPSGLHWYERAACAIVRAGCIPKHVAFIMDGNRRFARERGWDVARGHRLGYDKLEEALRWCCELGVHGVTVYAFSIENFKRSAEEVAALMALTEEKLRSMSEEDNIIQRRGVRVRVVGDLSRVSSSLAAEMRRVMRMTQGNTRHTLTVCFSYTATNEIATAVRRLADACERGVPCWVSAESDSVD